MNGIQLITKEREEQLTKHNRSIMEDVDDNNENQLSFGAMLLIEGGLNARNVPPSGWDEGIWHKMIDKSYRDRLVIAGALIAAEIDRLNFINIEKQ